MYKARLIAASLAMVLATVTPALAQESGPATGAPAEPDATFTQQGAYSPTNVAGTNLPAPGQQPDPGPAYPPGGSFDTEQDATSDTQKAAQMAQSAAQVAKQASDAAQGAAQVAPQEVAIQKAQEAQQASNAAQEAAQKATQAAAQEDAQATREAAEEAQQASGTAQVAAQATQQATSQTTGTDIRDVFNRALQAARPTGSKDDNVAFATERNPGAEADTEEAAGDERVTGETYIAREAGTNGEGTTEENASGEVGKETAKEGEAGPGKGAREVGSNTAMTTKPGTGSLPLWLGGGTLLVAGAFVARRIL